MKFHTIQTLCFMILGAFGRLSSAILIVTFSLFNSIIAVQEPVTATPAHSESHPSAPPEKTKSLPVSASKLTLESFNRLTKGADMQSLLKTLGAPARDIGSGIHIYEYELNDGSKVWVGGVEKLFYVDHIRGTKHVRIVGDATPANGNQPAQQ